MNEMHLFVELPGLACESNPCQNGGSCIPQGFQHKCICPDESVDSAASSSDVEEL